MPVASNKYEDLARLARAALVIAAKRRSLVTYTELGDAIGMSGVALSHEMRRVLDLISVQDREAGRSWTLAALVVNQDTGEPGAGWSNGKRPWPSEVQQAFKAHA